MTTLPFSVHADNTLDRIWDNTPHAAHSAARIVWLPALPEVIAVTSLAVERRRCF
jgi:hypothetical protein